MLVFCCGGSNCVVGGDVVEVRYCNVLMEKEVRGYRVGDNGGW